ncbi:HTH domain-containing protein [soil metagenome]
MTYSYLDLAYDVLKQSNDPLTYQEAWKLSVDRGLAAKLAATGKTPWESLGARLYVEVRDNPNSRFIPVGKRPMRFFLRERGHELSPDVLEQLQKQEATPPKYLAKKLPYLERQLHPILTYFAYANPSFNRGRSIYTKTICHEKSTKAGYNEWIHPDMVGFYLPLEDWQPNVIEFNRVSDNNSLKLFSFELKRTLNKSNYREAFFQAVSNSSWAHEGYLVAADVLDEDDFLAELERLTTSFGIGIIHLDVQDIDSSRILYPSRSRDFLDWETINKLCEQNTDFAKFLRDVKVDFEAREIHSSKYDLVISDIAAHFLAQLKH